MKTYYIPTSSLNFNNIFSSESVSPKGFYERRRFGYSRWTIIPENPLEGAILLYGEPKSFSRPISDEEDHPMLIEYSTNEEFPSLSEGIYYSTQTIYLDPWHTHVYFFSENDKITALSLSDSSLETKMLRLYRNQIKVKTFETSYPILENVQDFEIFESNIAKDITINKLKGLLYGYYIGANLSMSQDDVKQLHALYEINDIVSAILSNPEKRANNTQQQQLINYLTVLNRREPLYKELLELGFINDDPNKAEQILQLFRKYGIHLPLKQTEDILTALYSESIDKSPTLTRIQQQISNIRNIAKFRLLPNDSELVVNHNTIQTLKLKNEEASTLYKTWIEKVLVLPKYTGKINPERMDLATELAIVARDDVYKDRWVDTLIAKTYLNQLRKHLSGEEFTQQWTNGLLPSLAAVLVKGDDWEQLLQFMQYKEMYDYRLAFSLYGILNGFANLSRDFTDILLEQDSQYVTEIYTEFYGQLFDKKIEITRPKTVEQQSLRDISVEQKLNQEPSRPEFYEIVQNAWNGYDKKDNTKTKTLYNILNKSTGSTTRQQFITWLKEEKGFSRGSAIEYLKECLNISIKRDNNIVKQKQLFQESISNNILEDLSWIEYCESLIKVKKAKKQFREDIIWFADNHKESYISKRGIAEKGRYYEPDLSNSRIIARLESFMNDRVNPTKGKMQWLKDRYKDIPVLEIIQYLKQKYAD